MSNVKQEERSPPPTRSENVGSRFRAFQHNREAKREEKALTRIERDTKEAQKLEGERRVRKEFQIAREASQEAVREERKKRPSVFGGLFKSRPKRRTTRPRRRSAPKSASRKPRRVSPRMKPFHHGQHKNDIQCNIYRKKQRLARQRRAAMKRSNR